MANRPAFFVDDSETAFVKVEAFDFTWFAGTALARRQMSMRSLHDVILRVHPESRILEVSRMSQVNLGVQLSAFNLTFKTAKFGKIITVECAFQASKVFEYGGPFLDLLDKSSFDAKRDRRLSDAGRLTGFRFFGDDWPNDPPTAFYDWVYINALSRHSDLASAVTDYDVFTDIAFNPQKSINCQANSVALYVSLVKRGELELALSEKSSFIEIVRNRNFVTINQNYKRLFDN
ncbi:DarT1-associated NADAR antitoxin family protein [Sandaracinobacteroides hominis]|uniref:DarT1-associated NADAR antitoxin family protein n=1 Tax=Sandaracinobacteroides hominis TaxID=2780086 RepID=UPI0018F7AE02|nr:hypothetical protein [Sandaracinobacteroides hominis]